MNQSQIISYLPARGVQKFHESMKNLEIKDPECLRKLGIGFDKKVLNQMMEAYAFDAIQPTVTTGSIATPVQFLQFWMPGFVYVMTAARNIDDFVGISVQGDWEDEQIVQGILEREGIALPYGDYPNVNYANWNTNFNIQTIVRFTEGMQVDRLEERRAAKQRVDSANSKREGCALHLEIARNMTGFYGYNSGANNTYGLLNAPGLPSYVTVPNGAAGSPLWSRKTFLEIQNDILSALVSLRTQSQDLIDPEKVDITLGVATAAVDWLSTTTNFGISVRDWLRGAYPRVRVVSAPELNNANASANVFYLYAEKVVDQSTDDGMTFNQSVPSKFMMLGVQQLAKGFEEAYANATAGVFCKRPWAVVRRSGI